MCASYGLQIPASAAADLFQLNEQTGLGDLSRWLEENAGETVRPTGRIRRNLNPIVTDRGAELAWWGYLVGGAPSKFPSINTRSERLLEKPAGAKRRVLVPASEWFEYMPTETKKKQLWSFTTGGVFAIAGVAQNGFLEGVEYTCYSLVMQPARPDLEYIHDRMPLLLPQSHFDAWLSDTAPSAELVQDALDAGEEVTADVSARAV